MAGPKRGDGRGPRRGGPPIPATTPLSKQDQAYYEEIGQQLDVIEEAEEQMLLADNAFEQARTQLMEAASEKAVSRTLEKLIPKASTEAVSETLKAFVVGDNLAAVCGGCEWWQKGLVGGMIARMHEAHSLRWARVAAGNT